MMLGVIDKMSNNQRKLSRNVVLKSVGIEGTTSCCEGSSCSQIIHFRFKVRGSGIVVLVVNKGVTILF